MVMSPRVPRDCAARGLCVGAVVVAICTDLGLSAALAQTGRAPVRIAILDDSAGPSPSRFITRITEEVQAVIGEDRVRVEVHHGQLSSQRIAEIIDRVYGDPGVRVIIAAGPLTSAQVLRRSPLTKPTVAVGVIDPRLQRIPRTDANTSGVKNLNYLIAPTDIGKDLALLYRIRPYRKVAVVASLAITTAIPAIGKFLTRSLPAGVESHALVDGTSVDGVLAAIPADADAVYILPLVQIRDVAERRRLYTELARRGLAVVTMLGRRETENGAMASIAPTANFAKLVRRLALNVGKIVDGQPAADLPVKVDAYRDDLVLNMRAMRLAGIYPEWSLLGDATLVEVTALPDVETITLRAVVGQALEKNVGLASTRIDGQTARREVELARATLLPQIDASSTVVAIDQTRVNSSFGSQGRLTWSGKVELSQVIYSEPALANLTIQKHLRRATDRQIRDQEMELVRRAASAYITTILASNLVLLQNRNVAVSRRNLELAHARLAAGQSTRSDVARWESELALGKMDLLDAQANLRAAQHSINQIMNRPLDTPVKLSELKLDSVLADMLDGRFRGYMKNVGDIRRYARFLASEIGRESPALAGLDASIAAQKRLLKSRKRAYYAPTVALFGDLGYTFGRYGTTEVMLDPPFDQLLGAQPIAPTWTVGVNVSLPLFVGGGRKTEISKAKLAVAKLHRDRENARQGLELQLRIAMERTGARLGRIALADKARTAAGESLRIVQDSYARGAVPIAQLIDAQRAKLQADILAVNAIYEFLDAYLDVERALGRYYFLSTDEERDSFFTRFQSFVEDDR